MRFARAIWKLLVGVKDALVLIFMLMFFGLIYAGLSAKPTPLSDGVLAFDLNGPVVEQPSKADVSEVLSGGSSTREYRLRDLVAALDNARTDDRVKAVALDLDSFAGGGQAAHVRPFRRDPPRARFRQAGHRLCNRLYRRQLPDRGSRLRGLAQPARPRWPCRPGRTEPLLQGPTG